jgi:xanthosine utilization system XapX-like protein
MATLPDMLKALGAALVLTGVFAAVQLREPAPDAPATVQLADVAAQAAPAAAYPVLLPAEVPAGWAATASRIEPARSGSVTVNLGFTTADGAYVGIEQSDGEPRPYLAADVLDGRTAGTWAAPVGSATAGSVWSRRTAETSGDRALVLQPRPDVAATPGGPAAWVVVYGTAPWGDLERVAASLQPRG